MKKTIPVMIIAMLFALLLVGCQSSEPVDSVPAIVVPAPAPVAQAPAPAPVVEEAAEPETISGTLTYEGYSLTYDAVPGSATVYYPDFITDEEIDAFFALAFVSHSDYLAGVYYDIVEPGVMNVTFPEEVTVADATAVVDMLLVDLQSFIG